MLVKKVLKNIKSLFAKDTWSKKAIWLEADFPDYVSRKDGNLIISKFGLEVPSGKYEFVLDGFNYLKQLCELGGFRFSIEAELLLAKGKDFVAEIQTAEELFILREICLSKDYNFNSMNNVVVVDIGMNVGLASLYFASRKDVKHVYGFEPFKPTYQHCMRNLGKNQNLIAKITPHNFGLSHIEQQLTLEYDFDNKGQIGIHGTDLVKSSKKSSSKEIIQLKSILPEIYKIIERHPGCEVVCKIDCEGAEYQIFQSFIELGIPEAIKVVMMEWHLKGPELLQDTLRKNNFRSVATSAFSQDVGMIYAFRG
jgi:FkbM family methyltransferase